MCSCTVTPCNISSSKYIIKSIEHEQCFNLAEKWVCAWAPFPTIYILNTDVIVWALGKVGLCQSNSGFILLSHYTKWYYVDRDKCLRRQCSKMTLFQGKFNLESWTHFYTTEHRFSPIRAFHSCFAVGHVHVDFASCLSCLSHWLSRAGRNVNLKGKCAILMNIVFWTFCHLQGKNQ